jgi:hypothetical protein
MPACCHFGTRCQPDPVVRAIQMLRVKLLIANGRWLSRFLDAA